MRVLLINKFLYPKGGDAISTLVTGKLLSERGHEVFYWGMDGPESPDIPFKQYFVPHVNYNGGMKGFDKFRAAMKILYSFEAKKRLAALLKIIQPEMVHLNNFAHQLSPSILDAIKSRKIPAVMTMRDYKMVCPSYSMLSGGKPCERCGGGRYYSCLLKKCTKSSVFGSLVNVCEMYLHHNMLHTFDKIDLYISPSRFLMGKVKEMGLRGKVYHLPNFADLSAGIAPHFAWEAEEIVYVGRLSHEKGLHTLIEAVKGLDVRLKIIGDGPLKEELEAKVKSEKIENARLLGYMKGAALQEEIMRSMFIVLPSECYENNPRSIIEAFALGKPALGARIGGIPELVRDGETGFTFEAGNVSDLKAKIGRMLQERDKLPGMGQNARQFVERDLNPQTHYMRLMELYGKAIEINRARR